MLGFIAVKPQHEHYPMLDDYDDSYSQPASSSNIGTSVVFSALPEDNDSYDAYPELLTLVDQGCQTEPVIILEQEQRRPSLLDLYGPRSQLAVRRGGPS